MTYSACSFLKTETEEKLHDGVDRNGCPVESVRTRCDNITDYYCTLRSGSSVGSSATVSNAV